MLQLVDESIEDFLRATVPALAGDEVEVAFEAPDSEWGAGVTKPTVNLFLWDVRRNLDQRDAGMELLDDQDGKRYRRPPLPRIACPTLVLCGREDASAPLRLSEEMAALVPGARLEVVESCGHMSAMERPAEVTAALRRWLMEDWTGVPA